MISASPRKRPRSEAEVEAEAGAGVQPHQNMYESRKRSRPVPHGHYPREQQHMPPPRTHVNPSFKPDSLPPPYPISTHQYLLPSPGIQQKPAYPTEISDLANPYQDGQMSSLRSVQPDANPSLNAQPDPWDSQGINRQPIHPLMNQNRNGVRHRGHPSGLMMTHQNRTALSDQGSSTTGFHQDSGYVSQTPTVYSDLGYPIDSQSLNGGVSGLAFHPGDMSFGPYGDVSREDQWSRQDQLPFEPVEDWKCPHCDHVAKNKSDHNKHRLRHEKPFKCDHAGCTRGQEGFTTKNDLDRHKKSLHKIESGKSFLCAAKHCAKKTKVWPRADNFRQHCLRLHPTENINELMDKSVKLYEAKHDSSWEGRCQQLALLEPRRECGSALDLPNSGVTSDHIQPSNLVHMQDLDMSQSIDAPMDDYHHEDAVSLYSISEPPNSPYLNVTSTEALGHFPNHDSTAHGHRLGGNEQLRGNYQLDDSVLAGTGQHLAVPSPSHRGVKSPPFSGNLPVTHSPRSSSPRSNVMSSHEQELQMKNNRTSGASVITCEAACETSTSVISAIAQQLENSDLNKEEFAMALRKAPHSILGSGKSKKRSHDGSPSRNAIDTEERLRCSYCPKVKKTQCDLTKHLKRHTRPYGCTYSSCPRRFGSKNDWKRHENTMHWQIEAWKCAQPRDKSKSRTLPKNSKAAGKSKDQCGQVFYRREQFQAHLSTDHFIKDEASLKEQCRSRRIGQNGQRGFWCGFCEEVVTLEKRGLEAWDERFDHIDNEHFKRGKSVDEWYPMDKEDPKSMLKIVVDEEDEEGRFTGKAIDVEDLSETGDDEGSAPVSRRAASKSPSRAHTSPSAGVVSDATPSRRVPRSKGPPPPAGNPTQRPMKEWYCCKCNNGGFKYDMYVACLNCDHRRCGVCLL